MSINKIRRFLHLSNRTLGDFNAIKRGKIGNRVFNRVIGRVLSGVMNSLTRK